MTKTEGLSQFVSFRLDQKHFAVPLVHVERALPMIAVTPAPGAPPWLAGLIDLSGRVIPVVDLRRRFGQESREPALDDRLLVVEAAGQMLALMVDEVSEVLEIPAHQVDRSSSLVSQSDLVAAVVRRDEGLILVLDADKLWPAEAQAWQSLTR